MAHSRKLLFTVEFTVTDKLAKHKTYTKYMKMPAACKSQLTEDCFYKE